MKWRLKTRSNLRARLAGLRSPRFAFFPAFDFLGPCLPYDSSTLTADQSAELDRQALASDWRAVGNDLRRAMGLPPDA